MPVLSRNRIWFDNTDSSGTMFFDVMPYVDLYAKNQLLRDRSRDASPVCGARARAFFTPGHRWDFTDFDAVLARALAPGATRPWEAFAAHLATLLERAAH